MTAILQIAQAQSCQSNADAEMHTGKFIDAAHCEWPQQRAHWLDKLQLAAYKTTANTILTKIEMLEKQSRNNYKLQGADIKTAFASKEIVPVASNHHVASYDLNMGVYEYFCYKKQSESQR